MSRTGRAIKKPRTKLAEYARFDSRVGKASATILTTAELHAIGKKGAEARWSKKKRTP